MSHAQTQSSSKDDKQALRAVLQFLKNKNLKGTEELLRKEAGLDDSSESSTATTHGTESFPDISSVLSEYENEGDPSRYEEYYKGMEEFISKSLDLHKPELSLVLYPLFVHLYLELVYKRLANNAERFFSRYSNNQEDYRQEDLRKLHTLTKRQHMHSNNEILSHFSSSKYIIQMSRETFGLLKKHLQDNQQEVILNIIQQHFHLDVLDGRPRKKRALDTGTGGLTGQAPQYANKAKVFYGLIHEPELMAAADDDSEEDDEKGDKEKPKKKKSKKDDAKKKQAADPHAPKQDRILYPKMKDSDKRLKLAMYKEFSKRLHVGPNKIPSICFYTFLNANEGINRIQFSDDSSVIAAGMDDSSVRVWSLTPRKLRTLKPVSELAKIDKEVDDVLERIMNDRSATEQKTLYGHTGPVYGLSMNQDNSFLLSSSEDGTVRLWSLHTFTDLVAFKGHNYPVWDVVFSPKGYYFASASYDKTARLWCTENHQPLRIFAGHLADVNCIDFHPNCNYIATGSADRTVRIWDLLTGTCVRMFTGHKGSVHCVKFSPDGKHVVSSGVDERILLWDIAEGVPITDLVGHTSAVYSLCFSREGHMLASGGVDNCVKLWDIKRACHIDEDDDSESMEIGTDGTYQSSYELASFLTKSTPINSLHFTRRNLVMASGPFVPVS